MTTSYSSFREKVVYPSIRIGVLFLAAVAIALASWFETNESIDSCTFKNSLSFHQIHLYQNISSNLTTPDSVSVGLWKTCYFYSLNCTCSSTNIKYQPDIPNILQVATQNLAVPPEATATSLTRFAPLVVATLFAGLAVFLGFIANSKKHYLLRRIICGFVLVATALTAYVFGSTFKSYQDSIKSTCKDPNNSIYCTKYAIGVEVPIFGVGIGLLVLSLLFWFFSAGLLNIDDDTDNNNNNNDDDDDDIRCCGCFFKSKPEPEPKPTTKRQHQTNSSTYFDHYQPPPQTTQDFDAWQEADYYNNNYPEKAYYDQPYYPTNLQQKKRYTNNNNYSSARGHNPRVTSRYDDMYDQERTHRQPKKHGHNKRSSSHQQLDYYQQDTRGGGSNQHLDYYQQGTNKHSNPHLVYNQQGSRNSSSQHLDYYQQHSGRNSSTTPHYQQHAARNSNQYLDNYNQQSNDSFFVDSYQQDTRGSTPHLDYYARTPSPADYFQQRENKQQQQQQQQQRSHRKSQDSSLTFGQQRRRSSAGKLMESRNGSKTPTAMSPHPLLGANEYEEGSSGSNTSNQHVPILNAPPLEHPLNKKIIRDKRIQNYLQSASSNSSY